MSRLPKDCNPRVIGSTAVGIVHDLLPKQHWEYHGLTGTDHGMDCDIELIEDELFTNKHIHGQIKGTRKPTFLKNGDISFKLKVSVINYGLSSSAPFVLFLADVDRGILYYLPIQDYFIARPNLFKKSESDQDEMVLHIPVSNTIPKDDYELCQIAKSVYVDGPGRSLRKIR